MNKLLWTVVFVFSLMLGQSAFAESWYCGEKMKKMVDSLHLTADQKKQVKPILDGLKSSLQQTGASMKDMSTKIHQQVISKTMDESAVNDLVDQKTKAIADMMKAKIKAKNQIYMILDDKQKVSMQKMMQKWEEKMAEKYKKCKHND